MTDYLQVVINMIGTPENRYADPAAWRRLEGELGLKLSADYKSITDAYAPIQLNGHLYLSHPATHSWNLGQWIQDTIRAFSDVAWDELDLDPDEDPRELFGLEELAGFPEEAGRSAARASPAASTPIGWRLPTR
ncbi:hypothetical protein ACWEQP_30895 [Streptomyces sp. NPDC004044]